MTALVHEARTFVQALFSGYGEADALWAEVRCIPQPGSPRRWYPATDAGLLTAARDAVRWGDGWDCYIGVLPRLGRLGGSEGVSAARHVFADVDGGCEGVDGTLRLLSDAVSRGLPEPHMTVVSGNGIHVYWRLSSPFAMPTNAEREEFRDLLKRVVLKVGGKAPYAHADPSAADVARILRIPGTLNHKDRDSPKRVYIHALNAEATELLPVWWQAHMPAVPLPVKPVLAAHGNTYALDGLIRWASRPYPEGNRHRDLVSAAAWLVRDLRLDKSVALELLLRKASASTGTRSITERELERMVRWA
jgi:hypothetical protein